MSQELADLLRRGAQRYTDRWSDASRERFKRMPQNDFVTRERARWGVMANAVETGDTQPLREWGTSIGRRLADNGIDWSMAIERIVAATSMIETAVLEANDWIIPRRELILELADVRSELITAATDAFVSTSVRATSEASKRSMLGTRVDVVPELPSESRSRATFLASGALLPLADGDAARTYILRSGRARFISKERKRQLSLASIFPNDVCTCWSDGNRSFTVEALEPCALELVDAEWLAALGRREPLRLLEALIGIAVRAFESAGLSEHLLERSVAHRLAKLLLERTTDARTVTVRQSDLAAGIGSHRITVSKRLRAFETAGYVRLTRGSVSVVDPAALREFVDSGAG